jgi:hypothetical protein
VLTHLVYGVDEGGCRQQDGDDRCEKTPDSDRESSGTTRSALIGAGSIPQANGIRIRRKPIRKRKDRSVGWVWYRRALLGSRDRMIRILRRNHRDIIWGISRGFVPGVLLAHELAFWIATIFEYVTGWPVD